jgi:tetratricopeptide (TPR) repeat protein
VWPGGAAGAAAVALLAVLPYLNALWAGYAFDDYPVILSNPRITGAEPALGLVAEPDRSDRSLYRPVTMLTYAASARIGGGPAGFHLVNVALHAGVSLLVFRTVDVLLAGRALATVAAALFAVHPVHAEAVTAIVGRAELLAALFGVLSLLALVRGATAETVRSRAWSLASAGAFAVAVFSKESAITILPLGVVLGLWARSLRDGRRALAAVIPHACVLVGYLVARTWLVGLVTVAAPPLYIDNPLAHVGVLVRVATALVVLSQYLGLLTLPVTLSSDYSFNQVPLVTGPLDPRLWIALGVLGGLAAGLAAGVRRAPALGLAAALLVLPLGLTSNLLFPIGTIKAERLLYLPSVGWCVAAAWAALRLGRVHRAAPWAAVALAVIALAGRTWARNEDWRDRATAHAVAVRTAPMSAKAHYNWGNELVRQRRIAEALHHFARSVEIYPAWVQSRANLGTSLASLGRLDEAIPHLQEAARLEPSSVQIRRNLAGILQRQGRAVEAIAELEAAVRLDPAAIEPRRALGVLLLQAGRAREAEDQLAAVAQRVPRHADTQNLWGLALLQQGRVDDAIARFQAALAIDPGHAMAQANLRRARATRRPP